MIGFIFLRSYMLCIYRRIYYFEQTFQKMKNTAIANWPNKYLLEFMVLVHEFSFVIYPPEESFLIFGNINVNFTLL